MSIDDAERLRKRLETEWARSQPGYAEPVFVTRTPAPLKFPHATVTGADVQHRDAPDCNCIACAIERGRDDT